MAVGDYVSFNETKAAMSNLWDLDSDSFSIGLVTTAVTPDITDPAPEFTDYTEASIGGNYSSGGIALNATYGGTVTAVFDGDNVTWLVDGSNPQNARWAIIHNTTTPTAGAVGFLDLGAIIDMQATTLVLNINPSGIFTLTTAP